MPRPPSIEDPTPVYFRLQRDIQAKIENGELPPGERILPERHLAQSYRVSVGTVKKALLNLVYEGYLHRVQGKGTFVSGTTIRRESLRYYRLMEQFDGTEAELTIKLLDLKIGAGDKARNRLLKLRINQKLYHLQRVFYFDQTPMVYTESYLPVSMFPKLEKLPRANFENVTLYEMLEQHYAVPTIYNQELYRVEPVDQHAAKALNVDPATPLMFIEMLALTYKDQPYEYRESFCITGQRRLFREI